MYRGSKFPLRHGALGAALKIGLGAGLVTIHCPIAAAQPAATDAKERADADTQLDEIIVTARRRSERLQDIPVAVTAVSATSLENAGAISTVDLPKLVPGLYYRASDPSKPQIFIRGVGTRAFDAGSDASIATFIDGVYIGRAGGQIQNVSDLERIEVLKGPQGALFGRNTIGGAINIVTRKPASDTIGRASLSYGRASHFGGQEFNASVLVGGPLAETVSAQISLARTQADGPMLDTTTGRLGSGGGVNSARGRLVWNPATALELDFAADIFETIGSDLVKRSTDVGGRRPGIFLAAPGTAPPAIDPDPFRASQTPGLGANNISGGGFSAKATYTGTGFDITSISAVRHLDLETSNDLDATALSIANFVDTQSATQYSQEIRVASAEGGPLTFGDRISWIGGLYYYRERTDGGGRLDFGPASVAALLNGGKIYSDTTIQDVTTVSYAAFGQVGINITDKLKLDVALRYSHEKKAAHLALLSPAIRPGIITSPYDMRVERTDSSVDPTVSLSYKLTDNILLYGSYSSGFKGAAFQYNALGAAAASRVAEPESLDAFQGGIKADLIDRRLRLNIAMFRYRYKNLQLARFVTPSGGGVGAFTTENAAESTIDGIEAEGTLLLGNHVTVDYGYAYLDAAYDRYNYTDSIDFSGNRMTRSPKHSGNVAVTYDVETRWGDLSMRGAMNIVGRFYFEPDNAKVDPGTAEPSHTTFDASVSLKRGPYKFTIWGRNLGDEEIRAALASSQSGTRLAEIWSPRRSLGLTLAVTW